MSTSAHSTHDNFPSSEGSTDDCGLSPISSTDDEAPNGLCSPVHGFKTSSERSGNDYLALRSNDHVGSDGRAASTDMTSSLPDTYVERSMCHKMPRKVSALHGTKAYPTNAFSSTGDNSYRWCYLEPERLTNAISNGAEHKGTTTDLQTLNGELRRNNMNSALSSDPNQCREASRATINGSCFTATSGSYVQMDNVFDTTAPAGTTEGAATAGNIKPGWPTTIHESASIEQPLLSTMYADIPHMTIGRGDKKHSGTVKFPVASATCTKDNRRSRSKVPNCSASTTHAPAQLPARPSAEDFIRDDIASLWEIHASIIKTRTDNSERYDLLKNINMSSSHQQKNARPAPAVEDLHAQPRCSTSVSASDAEQLPPTIVEAQYEQKCGLLTGGNEKACKDKDGFTGNAFRRLNTGKEMCEALKNTQNIGGYVEFDNDLTTSGYRRRLLDAEPASTAPATKGSKRKTHQSLQPKQNKRTRSSSINKDVIGLPVVELGRKKGKDTMKVQDMPNNQQMRMRSNSGVIDEETGSTYHFDGSSHSPSRPTATETAHRDVSYSRSAGRGTNKETRPANEVTMNEGPAIPLCLLQQYDAFYAGVSDSDPRMLSGWKASEHFRMGRFCRSAKFSYPPAQD